ncbi:MAG: TGS domain-containing protein, partial [Thermoplasmata archaeon]|nr:TGS domain-containing protein [Thermoplasmata archaeon]
KGRGRGREVLSVVRSTDLILFLIDPEHTDFKALINELEGAGVRVNGRPPKIVLTQGERGGLVVSSTVRLSQLAGGLALDIAREFGVHNGSIVFREDATADQLIDVFAGNRVYIKAILAVNKADMLTEVERRRLTEVLKPFRVHFVSARNGEGMTEIIDAIGQALAFIRIYVKPPGREPDREEPVILRKGDRVEQLLNRLPTDLANGFKAAQVWGPSARFPGQTVGREHHLADEDVVTVVVQRGTKAGS